MNKKRLYKQSGLLHPRGQRVNVELQDAVQELFKKYGRYHPRDLELLIAHATLVAASRAVMRQNDPPSSKTVKSI